MEKILSPYCNKVNKEYPICLGIDVLNELNEKIKPYNPDKIIIVTENNVNKLYGDKVLNVIKKDFEADIVSIPAGEKYKTPKTYLNLCDEIISKDITKKSFVILLGGGVLGNLGGFAASTIMRGLRFAYLPTTIMAQADSTTGGKQGVNTKAGKNLLGIFNDPEFVFIDFGFLKTLPKREIKCGLAECIKHALCQDKEFYEELMKRLNPEAKYSLENLWFIIEKTLRLKMDILRMDPKEINEGKILVYGHTIGHAVETLSKGSLNHGESISIGMSCAGEISKILGFAGSRLVDKQKEILQKAGLPIKIPGEILKEGIIRQLGYDKKYGYGGKEFILLDYIGRMASIEGKYGIRVKPEFIEQAIDLCY